MNSRRCRVCGSSLSPALSAEAENVSGTVRFRISGVPIVRCGVNGHPALAADPEFGMKATEEIFFGDRIYVARQAFIGLRCAACGKSVPKATDRRGLVSGEVSIGGAGTFRVEIEGPAIRCPHCGIDQIRATRAVGNDISNAFARTLEILGIEA